MSFDVEIQLICKVWPELKFCEFKGQINFESMDVTPEILLVFFVAKLESRPVGNLIRPQLPVKRDVHMRPVFLGPVAVDFTEADLIIESEVYPIRKTMVHESQIRIVKVEMSRTVPEFQMFPDRHCPVLIDIKMRTRRMPELNVSVGESKAALTAK
jgi:hypothetical protein